jgi:hypothetical protein
MKCPEGKAAVRRVLSAVGAVAAVARARWSRRQQVGGGAAGGECDGTEHLGSVAEPACRHDDSLTDRRWQSSDQDLANALQQRSAYPTRAWLLRGRRPAARNSRKQLTLPLFVTEIVRVLIPYP